MKMNNRGNWTLIGLLVTIVIIFVAAAYFMGKSPGGPTTVGKNTSVLDSKSTKNTILGKAIDTGKAADCREHLNQIRMGIVAYKASATDDRNPQSFKDIGLSVGMDYYKCPVSSAQYTYDPATSAVKCPTHNDY